ncbi:SGNH/GDSL hydrolase family protein [Nostoc piscinale]|uniref:SGNH/GDSL hydrolase family protein n=1 Tax=Nostoc piscinale TaxID=224012 RepID=UPI000ACFB45F|nr:SGNH/GDSL hydrolase family protein [Nostoc piscinale]
MANLPDLGKLPATSSNANSSSLSSLTQSHNQGLRRSLKILSQQHSDLEIVSLDANTLYRNAIANPATFGFTNVVSACVSGSQSCGHPNQFLFWDGIHPTTAAHRIIADAAFSAIQEAGISTSVRTPTQT